MADITFTNGIEIDPNKIHESPINRIVRDYGIGFVDLPEEYQQVEYIESDGASYIDTNYKPNASTCFTGHVQVSKNDSESFEYIFGSVDTYHSSRSWELKYKPSTHTATAEIGRVTPNSVYVGGGENLYFEMSRARSILNINAVSVRNAVDDSSVYNAYIFALNHEGTAEYYGFGKLYSFKILEANDLVMNFIPCYRKSDSVAGLYDLVTGVFYSSASNVAFKKGENVNPPGWDKISENELYLNVFDENWDQIAVIDEYESLIWSDRYDEAGDFELVIPYDKRIFDLLKKDYFCTINLSEHGMVIEKVEIQQDYDDNPTLTVTGRSLEALLERRVVLKKKEFGSDSKKESLHDSVKTLLKENVISPENEKRKFPNFKFIDSTDEEVTKLKIAETYNGEDLYSIITTLCQDKHIGFKIALDYWNHWNFSLYAGKDRSYNQDKNEYVIFSPYYDNLKNSRYFSSIEEYRNLMIVAKTEETTVTVYKDTEPSGLDRREVYINASELQKNKTTELSNSKIRSKGKKKLTIDHKIKTAFEGDIIPDVLYFYRTDYFVGDKVQFEDNYGNSQALYISEVVITKDANGLSVIPTFKEIEEEWDA